MGLVFHRAPECVYHDVLPGGHAAAVLYGHRALEEKRAFGGNVNCVPGGAFHACVREPDGVGEVGRVKNHSDELIFHSQGLRRSAANLEIASENSPSRNSPRVSSRKALRHEGKAEAQQENAGKLMDNTR